MTDSAILLVDDDEATRYTLRRWLTYLQVRGQVLEAADGQQALDIVARHCQATSLPGPLFVLLDLQMPVLDGLEFLERQRQLPAAYQQALTVVVVSAAHETRERERARALAVEVKTKPLDVTELAALLQHYLPQALPAAS
jgi:CheY-like chemotaxis protein